MTAWSKCNTFRILLLCCALSIFSWISLVGMSHEKFSYSTSFDSNIPLSSLTMSHYLVKYCKNQILSKLLQSQYNDTKSILSLVTWKSLIATREILLCSLNFIICNISIGNANILNNFSSKEYINSISNISTIKLLFDEFTRLWYSTEILKIYVFLNPSSRI